MDYFVKGTLVVISTALIFIATQAYQINEIMKQIPPTAGEFIAASAITNPAEKEAALKALRIRMPVVRVHSGTIEVSGGNLDVSGSSVSVAGTVSIAGPVYTFK